ncbi:hypothetical protein LWI29_025576 [Acer saccharum]|uniref:Uncharacterized protein n=1 Tax=Acer saccharum TaxID=4024 RepID=A0AA39UW23_ACESA|nr:hypothetical protein LWI29_025576 [Acer saccharum]
MRTQNSNSKNTTRVLLFAENPTNLASLTHAHLLKRELFHRLAPVLALSSLFVLTRMPYLSILQDCRNWWSGSIRAKSMAKCMLADTMLTPPCSLVLPSYFINGTVRLLFQPAEEGGAGASYMVKEGVLGDSEAIFALHVASHRNYSIHFRAIVGRCEHVSSKNRGTRETDPIQSQVLSVTYLRGGTALNVVPSYVEFGGTLWSLTTQGQEAVHRCNACIDMKEEESPPIPAVTNDESLHLHVKRVRGLVLGPENVRLANKVMAGDDFAFYQEMIPGVELSIGI